MRNLQIVPIETLKYPLFLTHNLLKKKKKEEEEEGEEAC